MAGSSNTKILKRVVNASLSVSVESSPKTKRKCGSKNELENECKDVLFGANTMLACYCNEHDYCNTAVGSNNSNLILTIMTPLLISFWAFVRA